MVAPRLAIIGCGRLGRACGLRLVELGWQVRGLRRSVQPDDPAWMCAGEGAQAAALTCLGPADLVLLAAAPGLRAGGDNGLEAVAHACAQQWPSAQRVMLSSTAVYADAAGATLDEHGPLGTSERIERLLAIEQALQPQLVLRLGGLIGPQRQHLRQRMLASQGAPIPAAGPLDRPFSYCHDDDAQAIICTLLLRLAEGQVLPPILNVVAPDPNCSIRDYWNSLAREQGLPLPQLFEHGEIQPSRRVLSERLWQLLPAHPWRRIPRR